MAAREAELVQYHRDGVSITLSDGDGQTENLTGGGKRGGLGSAGKSLYYILLRTRPGGPRET